MRRISSRWTFFTKRVFPALWFGIMAVVFLTGTMARETQPQFVIIPIVMAGFGYFLMTHMVFDLADEVWDAGDHLVVRNAGREHRVGLNEVVNVNYSVVTNPQRVTLTLRQPHALGKELTFAPPTVWIPFARSPIVDDLIHRVDEARRR